MKRELEEVYQRLLAAFGPQHWWPGQTPLEVMVGAVLVQNTSWRNAAHAIENLRQADLLDLRALDALPPEELAELIRPAGYYRLKARRLQSLVRYIVQRYDGTLETMFARPCDELRQELLTLHGIGPETADAILLYAGQMPVFVVDSYTCRVLGRHGWLDDEADYDRVQEMFHDALAADAALYNEFHALLVRVGKDYCRKSQPKCQQCPLRDLLPGGRLPE
jgi:endonuclease III related protein